MGVKWRIQSTEDGKEYTYSDCSDPIWDDSGYNSLEKAKEAIQQYREEDKREGWNYSYRIIREEINYFTEYVDPV